MSPEPTRKLLYTGPSMNPALKEPDMIYVTQYHGRKIRRGDVVVFQIPGSTRKAIHRVIEVSESGITTRGDRNPVADPYLLRPEDIIGVVRYIRRGKKLKRIFGGRLGHIHGSINRIGLFRSLDRNISILLYPVYNYFSRSRALKKLLLHRFTPRIFSFNTPEGTEFQLFLGRYAAGHRPAGQRKWVIRRPFRLFVDESTLPD